MEDPVKQRTATSLQNGRMANENRLSDKEEQFLRAVLQKKMKYRAAGPKFHLSYDEMSNILAKRGIERRFVKRRALQSTLNAVKDVVDSGSSINAAAQRHNTNVTAVRHYMILNGLLSNNVNKDSQAPSVPEPMPEELQEIESIVDVQEKRQYLVKWRDAAEEEWVDEATFLAAVNKK